MLKSKYLHPHQLCQEGQVDHEHPQDPREWETHLFVKDSSIHFLKEILITNGENVLTV